MQNYTVTFQHHVPLVLLPFYVHVTTVSNSTLFFPSFTYLIATCSVVSRPSSSVKKLLPKLLHCHSTVTSPHLYSIIKCNYKNVRVLYRVIKLHLEDISCKRPVTFNFKTVKSS
jgi:hypothetical protein